MRALFRRRQASDFADEIASHLQLDADRLRAQGLSDEEAQAAARRAFGNVTVVREHFYESKRVLWLDHLLQDLRCAARAMAKYPIVTTVAVVSLAGGIGSTTATLTIRNAVFYNPPPLYEHPEQLSRVTVSTPEDPNDSVPARLYSIWSEIADAGYEIAAATIATPRDVRTSDRFETVPVRAVTPQFFSVLGVNPVLGEALPARLTASAKATAVEKPGTTANTASVTQDTTPVVLSYHVWQNLFGGRPDVIGSVLWIDDRPHTVSGVMPERFWFASMNASIWAPLGTNTAESNEALDVVIRRMPGVTAARVTEQLQHGVNDYAARLPQDRRQIRVLVRGIQGTPLGNSLALVIPFLIGGSVLFTLLISCANVAILMIAQWTIRERETAIRASLGASRWRIVRALLTESVLMAVCGGVLGLCATFALRGFIVHNVAGVSAFDLSIDRRILLQSAIVTLLAGIVAGIAPALYETRRLQANPLRWMVSSDQVRQRWRHTLVVAEITVTVALLVVAGTMVDAHRRTLSADLGFRTKPLLRVDLENATGSQIREVLERLKSVPGVADAAATTWPLFMRPQMQAVAIDAGGSETTVATRALISPSFFATVDVPIRAGRAFTTQDTSAQVAIVSAPLAERLWPAGNAVGSQAWIQGRPYEIVGVSAGYANTPLSQPSAAFFLPLTPERMAPGRIHLTVRAAADPAPLAQTVVREIRNLRSELVVDALTYDQLIAISGQEILVLSYAVAPLIAIAIFLTASGIYGVLAFAIARRSKELALRVAIGATRRDVLQLITWHTLRLLSVGTALGIAATFALTRVTRAAGGGGSAFDTPDWPAFALPVVIVVGFGLLATWIPSRRALKISPAILLRTD